MQVLGKKISDEFLPTIALDQGRDTMAPPEPESANQRIDWQLAMTLVGMQRATLQAADVQALYQEVCRIAIAHGAIRSAAVLVVAGDPRQLVVKAADGELRDDFHESSYAFDRAGSDDRSDVMAALANGTICVSNADGFMMRPTSRSNLAAEDAPGVFAAIPITTAAAPVGALLLAIDRKSALQSDLLRLMENVADGMTTALRRFDEITVRAETVRSLERLRNMFAALSATNEAILRTTHPEELYQRVCDAAVNGGKFTTTLILKADPETGWLQVQAMTGDGAGMMQDYRMSIDAAIPEGQGTAGIAYRTGQPSLRNNMVSDPRMTQWRERAVKVGIASVAAVPLLRDQRSIGVILFHSGDPFAFDPETVQLLTRIAENVVFALDNFDREAERQQGEARIEYLATHDGLTGLPNRMMFSQLLHATLLPAQRYQRRFALLFIDLDRFKFINDTYGHDAGDTLLRELGVRFRHAVRASDVIARIGGDEFVLLVQEMNQPDQAVNVARKILAAATEPIVLAGQECRISASVGIALFPEHGGDEQTLMKHADAAMYRAKEAGKNGYQVYSGDP